MKTVLNDILVVKEVTSKMKSSNQLLDQKSILNTATQTTITGNHKAHDMANSLRSIVQIFNSSFVNDIHNVSRISTAIENLDTQYKNMLAMER